MTYVSVIPKRFLEPFCIYTYAFTGDTVCGSHQLCFIYFESKYFSGDEGIEKLIEHA